MVNKALVEFVYLIVWYTIWNSVSKSMYWFFEKIMPRKALELRGEKRQYT
jgi:hypothetical protein